eukprot:14203390-Ditylum_brightwellii.AAC.1
MAAFSYFLRHRIHPSLIMRHVKNLEYACDPDHSLLLYRDEVRLDLSNELAALASDKEETDMSCQKT